MQGILATCELEASVKRQPARRSRLFREKGAPFGLQASVGAVSTPRAPSILEAKTEPKLMSGGGFDCVHAGDEELRVATIVGGGAVGCARGGGAVLAVGVATVAPVDVQAPRRSVATTATARYALLTDVVIFEP